MPRLLAFSLVQLQAHNPTLMKLNRIVALLAAVAFSPALFAGEGVIADAMKKFHKGETAPCKKVASGEASASELSAILKSYQDMAKETPAKGTSSSWKEKCDALIAAVTALKSGNKAATSDYKKAVNCKACHDVHKGK